MQVDRYTHTIQIRATFTEAERTVIEQTRTAPVGSFWERDQIDMDSLSIEDIELLTLTLGVCLGYEQPDNNIFEVNQDECYEDIPGGGELAPVAESLHQELTTILSQWGRRAPLA